MHKVEIKERWGDWCMVATPCKKRAKDAWGPIKGAVKCELML